MFPWPDTSPSLNFRGNVFEEMTQVKIFQTLWSEVSKELSPSVIAIVWVGAID